MSVRQSLLARLRNRIAAESSVRQWRRSLFPLRAAIAPPPQRSVLFCNLMTMPSTAKVESLMAGLLRLKGYRTRVLLERPDRPIEGIFRAAAPEADFLYREEGIGLADREQARQAAQSIMAELPNLQALVRLEIDGFRIGRNVQSIVLRKFRVGRLDDADPQHRAATLNTLAESLATKSFVQRLLKEDRPDTAIFIERGYTPAGEIFDGCIMGGVDVVQWCGAPQSDCLIYRRYNTETRGEHPLALSDEMWRKLLEMPWSAQDDAALVERIATNYESGAWYNRQQLQEGKRVIAADNVRRMVALDPEKKSAIIFCHILYDATFFYGDSLFDDYEQWMVETVRAAIANPRLNWIIKVHPVNVWRSKMDGAPLVQLEAETLRRHFGVLPDHVTILPADTAINTFSLFDVADYGLTVRGTIGMELPCFGIPVVTAGTGRYSGRGFTIDPASRAEYAAVIAHLHEVPRLDAASIRRARLHYYGALNLRPVPMRSFMLESPIGATSGPAPGVTLSHRADVSLLDTDDLGRLVKWLTESRALELLARDLPAVAPLHASGG